MTKRGWIMLSLGMGLSTLLGPFLVIGILLLLLPLGIGAAILGLFAFYVGIHALAEPYRPPWESSLFPDHIAARIRQRRWLNPTREGNE